MRPDDLAAIGPIQAAVHPSFPEDEEVFAERLRLYPAGCFMLESREGPVGYIVSHPWRFGHLPALNSLLGALPAEPSTFYIHDIALLPSARGGGVASSIVATLIAHAGATGLASLSLVAVNDSQPFWRRHGFAVVDDPALAGKLATYDDAARLMARPTGVGAA
jgi:ribosomal protein S18 acetylase RimI-like enzyme